MTVLNKDNIKLNQTINTREEAIIAAGNVLVENGYVEKEYIQKMIERDNDVSTYMGNFIAIPHGTADSGSLIKESGISIIQIPSGVNFGDESDEKMVTIVFGIAGKDGKHLDILSEIALVASEVENIVEMTTAETEQEIIDLLGGL